MKVCRAPDCENIVIVKSHYCNLHRGLFPNDNPHKVMSAIKVPQREMTLKEWVYQLPESHRARIEYDQLISFTKDMGGLKVDL